MARTVWRTSTIRPASSQRMSPSGSWAGPVGSRNANLSDPIKRCGTGRPGSTATRSGTTSASPVGSKGVAGAPPRESRSVVDDGGRRARRGSAHVDLSGTNGDCIEGAAKTSAWVARATDTCAVRKTLGQSGGAPRESFGGVLRWAAEEVLDPGALRLCPNWLSRWSRWLSESCQRRAPSAREVRGDPDCGAVRGCGAGGFRHE